MPQHWPFPYQGVSLHVLPAGELLPADLAGIRPLARVRPHVSLEDALVHGRETAVRALELLPDDRELVNCKRAGKTRGLLLERLKTVRLVVYYFAVEFTERQNSHLLTTCNIFVKSLYYIIALQFLK